MGVQKRTLGLAGSIIPRAEQRRIDQRCEERRSDVVDHALITFRGEHHLVRVGNISTRGTMIETSIMPRIGEAVFIQFENCTRIHAFVRWVRDGHVGLSFGHEIILG